MRSYQILASLILPFTLLGCGQDPNASGAEQMSASAAASIDANGDVVTRKPAADELLRLSDVTKRMEDVDRRFPRGIPPLNVPLRKASRMLPTGDLVLEDGSTVILDGVSCTERGYEYLSRFFLDASTSLVIVETGDAATGKVPAEVWAVEHSSSGTSTAFPVEAGISTGWCDARRSATSPHNDRFAALETAFAAERESYKRAAP